MEPCLFKFLLSLGTNSSNKKLGQVECAINWSSFLLNEANCFIKPVPRYLLLKSVISVKNKTDIKYSFAFSFPLQRMVSFKSGKTACSIFFYLKCMH